MVFAKVLFEIGASILIYQQKNTYTIQKNLRNKRFLKKLSLMYDLIKNEEGELSSKFKPKQLILKQLD